MGRGYWKSVLAELLIAGSLMLPLSAEPKRAEYRQHQGQRYGQKSGMDSALEVRIDAYVKSLKKSGYLSSTDKTSFVVYDIGQDKKVASINEDRKVMAASTIKIFVMLAYFDRVKAGKIKYTSGDKILLAAMVQKSSNSATNALIRKLGGPRKVEKILSREYPYFDETDVVQYIPRGGKTYKNTTSAHDLNIFYNQMWRRKLPHSNEMRHYLGLPGSDRIFDGTCIPNGTHVFNKTGTVYGLVADSGILLMRGLNGQSHPYAITAIIEDRTKTRRKNRKVPLKRWKNKRAEVIRTVSEGAYDYLYKMHTGDEFLCKQHDGKHLRGGQ